MTFSEASTNVEQDERELRIQKFLAARKEAAARIDPETADVGWAYVWTLDPYGIDSDLPDECQQVGRAYFAQATGSDIWVWFGDLPHEVRKRLWQMHRSNLAFPICLFDAHAET